LVKFIK